MEEKEEKVEKVEKVENVEMEGNFTQAGLLSEK